MYGHDPTASLPGRTIPRFAGSGGDAVGLRPGALPPANMRPASGVHPTIRQVGRSGLDTMAEAVLLRLALIAGQVTER
jgi:hypothetical protein